MKTLTDRATAALAWLDAQLAICKAATKGPWREGTNNVWQDDLLIPIVEMRHRVRMEDGRRIIPFHGDSYEAPQSDAAFIAAARTGYPSLLDGMKVAIEALSVSSEEALSKADKHWSKVALDSILTKIESLQ